MGLDVVEFTDDLRASWLHGGRDFRVHRPLYMASHALHGCAPKTPQAVLLNHEGQRVEDFLTGLRLVVEGELGRGPQYQRMLIDGKPSDTGYMFHPIWEFPFRLVTSKVTLTDLQRAEDIGDQIAKIRATNPNLELALRRFNYSYTRDLVADELLDLTVGLESLFAADGPGEIGFKIASRSARLISQPPQENHLTAVRALYRVRSEIVHGGHYERIQESKSLKRLAAFHDPNTRDPHATSEAARKAARDYVRLALLAYLSHSNADDAHKVVRSLDLG
jgi:hypothetical protein